MKDAKRTSTAFALAGLGGFNAHGAGFLTAASDCGVVPELVTATSGQIVVLADWLQGKNLERSLVNQELEHNWMAQAAVAASGYPGVFRPAYEEAWRRWLTPLALNENAVWQLINRLLPAQLYVPTRTRAELSAIAEALKLGKKDGHEVGVVFSAYNIKTGEAVLFGNEKAQEVWPRERAIPLATRSVGGGRGKAEPNDTQLEPITTEAVQSALWLSLYGFDGPPFQHLIDGAYHRACIISELHTFDRVFVARPLAQGWTGKGPRNWFEVQDWQTEMWFSVGYKAEVDALHQINGLLAAGVLTGPYKNVELIEIAPSTPAGFFNYFIERENVFRRAYEEALARFAAVGLSMVPAKPTAEQYQRPRSTAPSAAVSLDAHYS